MPIRHPQPSHFAALLVAALAVASPPLRAETPVADDLGSVDFPTSAQSPEAQRHFLRGVAALHNFWYDEAADAFRTAQQAEPGFALAYWGEALSYHHTIWQEEDLEASRAALARLAATPEARAAKAPTEREKGYLAAAEALLGEGSDRPAREAAYSAALARLAERFPDDLEAASLWALSLIGPALHADAGEARTRALIQAAARLEELFDRNPSHPGVLHYLIHAYDDPVHAPLGLRAARLYARVAPAAHHALHMPSHIFVQLGQWADVEASNRASWEASVAWVARRGLAPDKRDFHSLQWLHYAQLQRGRHAAARATLAIARQAAAEAAESRANPALRLMEARQRVETAGAAAAAETAFAPSGGSDGGATPGATAAASAPAANAAGTGSTPSAAAAGGPHAGHGGGEAVRPALRASLLLADGLDAARRGDLAAAQAATAALDGLAAGAGADYRDQPIRVAAKELAGVVRLREGKVDEALALLAEAALLEAAMPAPMGPPEPIKPAAELLGEALLATGNAEAALARFETSLLRTPNRALSLLGAARAATAQGDTARAARHYQALAEVWAEADARPPEVAEALRAAAGSSGSPRP